MSIKVEPLRIVVADDDYFQRVYAVSLLAGLGHSALEAEDGAQALELLRESKAQILMCDLDMPGIDGHSLVRQVRTAWHDDTGHYVHILMVTASSQIEDREAALDAGVDDFMIKPLEPSLLSARIASLQRMIRHESLLEHRKLRLEEANNRILRDLQAASSAQRRLLPKESGTVSGMRFHSEFAPSSILSGDMFGFFELRDGHVGLYAIDVSGHGVRASLKSVALGHLLTRAYFNSHGFRDDGTPDPAKLIGRLNDRFYDEDHEEYFTMFCAIYDSTTGRLTFCNAGYQPPWHVRDKGSTDLLDIGGFPVSLLSQAAFENSETVLQDGEFIVLCSDGATEAASPEGETFGEGRVADIFGGLNRQPADIPARLIDELSVWRGGAALEDDLTILICERTTPK